MAEKKIKSLNGARALAAAVIVRAAEEAREGNKEAIAWLRCEETRDTWLFLAGLDFRAVLAWLDRGCPAWRRGKKTEDKIMRGVMLGRLSDRVVIR